MRSLRDMTNPYHMDRPLSELHCDHTPENLFGCRLRERRNLPHPSRPLRFGNPILKGVRIRMAFGGSGVRV